ncbi:MAG: MASE4 domain-containing protein [Proteobacteria bacterium]|nr:MASE4 domain-containing protein [Pseudomonadota bacterium]
MAYGISGDRRVFLSLLPASASEKKLAVVVIGLSLIGFAAAAPFAKMPLVRIDAFIPIYQSALALNDFITAILLFGQFSIMRWRGLLFLAGAYLFTSLMVIAHLLSFPGAFAPTGLFGAGPHTTAWLYVIWHSGFPLLVMAYALTPLSDGLAAEQGGASRTSARAGIATSVVLVVVCVIGALMFTTLGHSLLPPAMAGNKMVPAFFGVITIAWATTAAALLLVWRRGSHCVLDLWLMVSLCAWLLDIALSGLLNAGRFDLGFYVGRIYGLCAASFVLASLLLETRALYARLAHSLDAERMEAERRARDSQQANLALRQSESHLQALNETLEQRVAERSRQLEEEVAARARVQDALRETQKVEAIGRMAGGIAHDFNNLLTIVLGNAEILQSTIQSPAELQAVRAIDRAAERGVQLIRQILTFSRRQSINPEVIDLTQRADEFAEMLGRTVRGDVEIVVSFAPDLWAIACDAAELELALMNLCVNARDAMSAGGLVCLDGCNVTITEHEAAPSLDKAGTVISSRHVPGDFVALALSDAGTGIMPEDLGRVFDPFFTTKEVGKGTGLGLSQVYGFAQQAGGRVGITSTIGKGTTVTLYLPRSLTLPMTAAEESRPGYPTGRGNILLVEDDEQVAKTATAILASIGYDSTHVLDAGSALALLLGGRVFDLVFSDIVMPGGMSGLELARKIRQHFPGQPILLATGYSRAAADIHSQGFSFIAKPYRADALAAAIGSAIEGGAEMRSQDTA